MTTTTTKPIPNEARALAGHLLAQAQGDHPAARRLAGDAYRWLCSKDETYKPEFDTPAAASTASNLDAANAEIASLRGQNAKLRVELDTHRKANDENAGTIRDLTKRGDDAEAEVARLNALLGKQADETAQPQPEPPATIDEGAPLIVQPAYIAKGVEVPAPKAATPTTDDADAWPQFAHLPPKMRQWAIDRAKAAQA
jgi:hypothetical protein